MKGTLTNAELIVSKFATPDNSLGLGKLIYLEGSNETVITNGKSLITFSNAEIGNCEEVTEEETARINALVTNLIHLNFGENTLCELYLSKEDVNDMLCFLAENISSKIEVVFDKDLEVLLLKTPQRTLVKIIPSSRINSFKNKSGITQVDALQLYNMLQLVSSQMDDVIGIAIQSNRRPLLIESNYVKGCISSNK